MSEKWALAIHGGAGILKKDNYTQYQINEYQKVLDESLKKASELLIKGASSLEAVTKAVTVLEDSPLFNAGKGAVIGNTGLIEMDASIMDGKTTKVGGASCVKRVKNPILLAKVILEKSPHSLLVGDGAEYFAYLNKLDFEGSDYFYTDKRWLQMMSARENEQTVLDHEGQTQTVGAVALDLEGNLSAATSTGGMTNKAYGRASDTSIIGAGNYANNKTCAISGTGTGDQFIRNVTCFDFHALIEYKGLGLKEASDIVLKKLKDVGGYGGLIAIDPLGNIAMEFNSGGMFRAKVGSHCEPFIGIF